MALQFTGAGGVFYVLGKIGTAYLMADSFRRSVLPTVWDRIAAQFDQADPLLAQYSGSKSSAQLSPSSGQAYLAALARDYLIEAVDRDRPMPQRTIQAALAELIRQMRVQGATVDANAVTAAIAAGEGVHGAVAWVASTKDVLGVVQEDALPEVLTATVAADSLSGGRTAGRESFLVAGEPAVSDGASHLWPGGSGASLALLAIDAAEAPSSTGNLVRNGTFEAWTGNTPTHWTVAVGTAGTHVDDSATAYDGSKALALVGDGTTLTALRQPFDGSATGAATLYTLRQYAVNFWARVSAAATGVLRVAIVDGSGNILADDQGTPNAFTVDLATLSTTYAAVNGCFRIPAGTTGARYLELKATTAIQSGRTLLVDRLAMAPATQLYRGGPSLCPFSGNAGVLEAGDFWLVTAANDGAGLFQTLFERWFGMRSLGLLLPSATPGTIADTLVEQAAIDGGSLADQVAYPESVASGEAFGTPSVLGPILDAGGIASAEAVSTLILVTPLPNLLVDNVGGIASGESFGAPNVVGPISGAGDIASGEAFGLATLVAPIADAGGIASGEAVDAPTVAVSLLSVVVAAGAASGEAFGSPSVLGPILGAGGIASGEAFDSPGVAKVASSNVDMGSNSVQAGGMTVPIPYVFATVA